MTEWASPCEPAPGRSTDLFIILRPVNACITGHPALRLSFETTDQGGCSLGGSFNDHHMAATIQETC